ncbi:MAG: hypothetical protein IJ072_00930 [Oscillospiraceae bacterium]|nr:hypothetical protein [Oscillospiraceae bacterium]
MKLFYAEVLEKGHDTVYRLLAHAVERTYGTALPVLKKTPEGKPYFPDRGDIFFSLSHTKTHVMCALSGKDVGCDIESPRPVTQGLALRVNTPEQLEQFDFFTLWTLKESFIKLKGRLDRPMRAIDFSRCGENIKAPELGMLCASYHLGGCTASVCGYEPAPQECIFVPASELYP